MKKRKAEEPRRGSILMNRITDAQVCDSRFVSGQAQQKLNRITKAGNITPSLKLRSTKKKYEHSKHKDTRRAKEKRLST